MKKLSRILTICLCSAPFINVAAYAVPASTAGHNLTAYNPSNSGNNQWAILTNARDNTGQPAARADFGNCNAIVMRCATPKCANGGCVDANVAAAIVAGCVQTNDVCAQYGNELISYMSAQLVANSTAKVNAQRAASDAAAVAAQNATSQQTAQQIAEMQATMQSQMAQMQQQMQQQNAQTQQQLQNALAAQAEQNAMALQNITAAATTVTPAVTTQLSVSQEKAIDRGISSEVLVRQQITGQIMTEIENAEVSLKAVKTAMQNSFEYAGCDARGNNCTGPKRIKKWRELATDFLEPYDNTIDKIYDALITAQTVGVPLDDIYMMLNDSCSAWAQYMCPPGTVTYPQTDEKGNKGAPMVCPGGTTFNSSVWEEQSKKCNTLYTGFVKLETEYNKCLEQAMVSAHKEFTTSNCQYCTMLKVLTDKAEVYEGWVYADANSDTNQTVVACASTILDTSKLFQRRTKNKNGAGLVDIDTLDTWLHQTEPSVIKGVDENMKYCFAGARDNDIEILQSSVSSRNVPAKGKKFCVEKLETDTLNENLSPDTTNCPYIAGTYAICDTHPYNNGIKKMEDTKYEDIEAIKEIVALKVTVISQQMYKQYEYLNATLRRLKTQLEKTVLTSTLEAAGAKSDGETSSSSGGGLLGSGKNSQYTDCSGKDLQGTLYCLRQNYSALSANINNKKCDKVAKQQLKTDVKMMNDLLKEKDKVSECNPSSLTDCKTCLGTYNAGLIKLENENLDREAKRRGYRDY